MQSVPKRYPSIHLVGLLTLLTIVLWHGHALAAGPQQETFATPEKAVQALAKAAQDKDAKSLQALFGPASAALFASGDAVEDRQSRERFIQLFQEKNRLETADDTHCILHVGDNDWPFPIPLVKTGARWHFDTPQGRQEILSRRIGRNELDAIQTCLAIADAQREYASEDRNGDGLLEYTTRFVSTKGKHDGLYWDMAADEAPSPLGHLVAQALNQGYAKGKKPVPYQGYCFRILTAQGKNAPGGAYRYLAKGKMVGGFALVAYPVRYGASGIKTFMVNHTGVVYQKDLGPRTATLAPAMQAFDPDKTWEKAE